jgi:hypothetical protein
MVSALSWAYLFTDFWPSANPPLGVYHPSGLPYLFGNVSTATPLKVASLSRAVDLWWFTESVLPSH